MLKTRNVLDCCLMETGHEVNVTVSPIFPAYFTMFLSSVCTSDTVFGDSPFPAAPPLLSMSLHKADTLPFVISLTRHSPRAGNRYSRSRFLYFTSEDSFRKRAFSCIQLSATLENRASGESSDAAFRWSCATLQRTSVSFRLTSL